MTNQTLLKFINSSQFTTGASEEYMKVDWDGVYKEAVSQAVIGIVAHEVPAAVLSDDPRWQQAIYRQQANRP